MSGCGSGPFFIPVCQAYNTCTTTTSTTPTSSAPAAVTKSSAIQVYAAPGGTGAANAPSAQSFLYVASASQKNISTYSVSDGRLSSAGKPLTTPGAAPSAVAATVNGNLLYAATESGSIYSYRIGSGGNLQIANGGSAIAHVDHPVRMSLDRSGNWLFVASSSDTTLRQFRVDAAKGTLQPSASGTPLSAPAAAQIYFSPDNRNLFAALGSGGVDAFAFDPSSGAVGQALHLAPRNAAGKDTALTSDAASRFLFVGETGSGVRVLRIVADGTVQEASGSPFSLPKLKAASLAVAPTSGHLLVADSAHDTVRDFSIGKNGTLTPLSDTASNVAPDPAALTLTAGGRDLIEVSSGGTPSLKALGSGS